MLVYLHFKQIISEVTMPPSAPHCWACQTPLTSHSQKLCTTCNSWQKFPRRWIGFSTSVLALVVAGISVGTTFIDRLSTYQDKQQIKVSIRSKSLHQNTNGSIAWNFTVQNMGKYALYIAPEASCSDASGTRFALSLPPQLMLHKPYMAAPSDAFFLLEPDATAPQPGPHTCVLTLENEHGFAQEISKDTRGTPSLGQNLVLPALPVNN
ncbi:hypothetical protein [Pelagimonas phthalicica]|nr:hypothetical protein [Pelagimonas phthalicica]